MLWLLLLQVLASCLCLGHSEVVTSFKTACTQFFYEKTPPGDTLRPTNAARICQSLNNKYHFATMYDKTRRIPVYSAYIYKPGSGDRFDSWFVEPQVLTSYASLESLPGQSPTVFCWKSHQPMDWRSDLLAGPETVWMSRPRECW